MGRMPYRHAIASLLHIMGADQVLGGAWIHAQEVAAVPLALHLLPVVLVGGGLERDLFTEDSDGLQALVISDILVAHSAIGLNKIATYRISSP